MNFFRGRIALYAVLGCALSVALARAQQPGANQVLAVFSEGTITLPDSLDSGELSQVVMLESDVDEILASFGVTQLARAFPEFDRADTVGVAFTGETVRLTDWSKVWIVTLPNAGDQDACVAALRASASTVLAEPNGGGAAFAVPVYPNDPDFEAGAQWGLWSSGAASPNVHGPWAWGTTRGSPSVRIAVIDDGFVGHPDLDAGRLVYADGAGGDRHPYLIAGIAGARTDNGVGMAGVDWEAGLVSARGGWSTPDDVTIRAINTATGTQLNQQRARVLNASWGLEDKFGNGRDNLLVQAAFKDHYARNGISVCAMGNRGISSYRAYPANYPIGVLGVGAATQSGDRWFMSSTGPAIDVVAPGVGIRGLTESGGYADSTGTSFAAPFVAGAASLLIAKNPSLNADDIENLIRVGADDISPAGWDTLTGCGMLNIDRTLALLDPPHRLATGVVATPYSQVGRFAPFSLNNTTVFDVSGIDNGIYNMNVREIYVDIAFGLEFSKPPIVWGRGGAQVTDGWRYIQPGSPNRIVMDYRHCFALPAEITTTGCRLRTFIYEIPGGSGNWYPQEAHNDTLFHFAWSALDTVPRPSASNSYFVPQAGMSQYEGWEAYRYFRACPNNDGAGSLPQQARLKVVLKDGTGAPIPNVRAEDVFILFNKGPAAQGFVGDGADSVIANGVYNTTPLCPNLQAIPANGPTDATGTTYITFTGAGGLPDPARRWGHYDSEIPVYALGVKLQGRVTSGASNGTYDLQIKNFDWTMGLSASENQGEIVSLADLNGVAMGQGVHNTISFWKDFDWNGEVALVDLNMILAHLNHDCCTPLP